MQDEKLYPPSPLYKIVAAIQCYLCEKGNHKILGIDIRAPKSDLWRNHLKPEWAYSWRDLCWKMSPEPLMDEKEEILREKVFQLGSQCWILKHYRNASWTIHIEYSLPEIGDEKSAKKQSAKTLRSVGMKWRGWGTVYAKKKVTENFLTFSTSFSEVQACVIQDMKYVHKLVDMQSIRAKCAGWWNSRRKGYSSYMYCTWPCTSAIKIWNLARCVWILFTQCMHSSIVAAYALICVGTSDWSKTVSCKSCDRSKTAKLHMYIPGEDEKQSRGWDGYS